MMGMKNIKLNRKTMKLGSFTVITTALVLLVLVFANLLVGMLPSSLTKLDTTKENIYALHDESLSILSGLQSDVNIYMILASGEETDTTTQVSSLIERYSDASSRIKFSTVDPAERPTFTKQYTDEELQSGAVIVECGEKSRVITSAEWFMFETENFGAMDMNTYSYYYSYGAVDGTDPYMFYGEKNITGAIDYVTSANIPKAYILKGHGESDISASFMNYITEQNIEAKDLNLLTGDGKVPADCDALIINAPQNDISENEGAAISDYLKNGGNVMLITDAAAYSSESMPNLADCAESMGLSSAEGCIVEGDPSYYYVYGGPLYLVPQAVSNDGADSLVNKDYPCVLPLAHPINAAENAENTDTGAGFNILPLLATSESSYTKSIESLNEGNSDKAAGDAEGPFNVAVLSETESDGGASSLIWISSPYFTDASYDAGGNSKLFVAALNRMCEKEETISLLGVRVSSEPLNIASETTVSVWNAILTWIIPIAVLGGGLAVWIVRRRK